MLVVVPESRVGVAQIRDVAVRSLSLGAERGEAACAPTRLLRWIRERPEALLQLRCIEINGDWASFVDFVEKRTLAKSKAEARVTRLLTTRLVLLSSVYWLTKLTTPLFSVLGNEISTRDVILIAGGLFRLAKSTFEIHSSLEVEAENDTAVRASLPGVIIEILILDLVFSLDSVITAIGMAEHLAVMATAVIVVVGFMLWFARAVSDFVERHPTIKMLALSFLLLIAVALVAEGLDLHIPKGYLYFAMTFSFLVELLNMKVVRRQTTLSVSDKQAA